MQDNSIFDLIKNGLENLKPVIDVNTVVGDPVDMPNGDKIFPLVKVSVGYVAGGGEYANKKMLSKKNTNFPFAGGSSAGCTAEPIGFLIAKKSGSELITVSNENAFADIAKKVADALAYFVKKGGKATLEKVKKCSEKSQNVKK